LEDGLWRIADLVEKPEPAAAPSRLAIIGRYVLPPDIFAILETTGYDAQGEIQLTEALRTLARQQPLNGYCVRARRYDSGNKLGYLIATVELALRHAEIGKPFREYLRGLSLDE
jgi:UTP--glucose-1-phosphate uridylyltransferase